MLSGFEEIRFPYVHIVLGVKCRGCFWLFGVVMVEHLQSDCAFSALAWWQCPKLDALSSPNGQPLFFQGLRFGVAVVWHGVNLFCVRCGGL